MKRCSRCGEELPLDAFHRHRGRKDGRQTVCKACKRRTNAEYYSADPTRHQEARARNRRALRDRVSAAITSAKAAPCADCGRQLPPEMMDLDHVRGRKVADSVGMRRLGLRAALEEIRKCDVVCVNCHRVRTKRRRNREMLVRAAGWNTRARW